MLFALGHGAMLFVFVKILEGYIISDEILGYGDIISSSVIILMGIYLLYMSLTNKILLNKHKHKGLEHIHISFSKNHNHNEKDTYSAICLGALMGIGGVRGMLVTLGVIQSASVDLNLVGAFVLGVSVVFITFGYFIYGINKHLLNNGKNIKTIFATLGLISVGV
jgi:cytochrome c biogenesis protein CcdA